MPGSILLESKRDFGNVAGKRGMDISLVLCTWNNAERLAMTLEAITRCVPAGNIAWEIILVDNNSTDHTKRIVDRFCARLPIHYVFEPVQGLSQARNAGLSAATGKLILFTDDDVTPCTDWIEMYWRELLRKPSGYYFGGSVESDFEDTNFDHALLEVAPFCVRGFSLGTEPKEVIGEGFLSANWACPAEALKTVGNFDVSRGLNPASGQVITGEETDLMLRLQKAGWKGYYLPWASVKHFVPARKCTLKHIASRVQAYGYQLASSYECAAAERQILGIPRWIYRILIAHYTKYLLKRITGHGWHKEYAIFIQHVGFMKGLRQTTASAKPAR
jgi:glucosyl-dolichyl phosphate glucuronosyltransferase